MKLFIHSQTSTVQPLKFGNGYVIPSHTLLGMWLLINAGIKVNMIIKTRQMTTKLCAYSMGYTANSYHVVHWSSAMTSSISSPPNMPGTDHTTNKLCHGAKRRRFIECGHHRDWYFVWESELESVSINQKRRFITCPIVQLWNYWLSSLFFNGIEIGILGEILTNSIAADASASCVAGPSPTMI